MTIGGGLWLVSIAPAMGQANVDALITQLSSPESTVRAQAACALGRIGSSAKRAVPALLPLVQAGVRAGAMREKAQAAPWPLPRDRPLTACELASQEIGSRAYFSWQTSWQSRPEWDRYVSYGPVVWAIVQLEGGELAASSVLKLFRRDPELRCDHRYVVEVLGALGPNSLPALEEGLRDDITQVRYFAIQAIPKLRPLPPKAETLARHAIDWDMGDVRSAAVVALDEVRAYLRDRKQHDRDAATRWLSEFAAYPRARFLCALPGSSVYATADTLGQVLAFYGFSSGGNVALVSNGGRKRLSIRSAVGSYSGCRVPPRSDDKAVLILSQSSH